MDEHQVKVQYYHCGLKHLDEHYFLRSNTEIPVELKNSRQLLDEQFFTRHDHTFSVIMADEMLADYIREELVKLESAEQNCTPDPKLERQRTGKKIDKAELSQISSTTKKHCPYILISCFQQWKDERRTDYDGMLPHPS